MPSRRYTIVIADRTTGTIRRFTIRLRPLAIGLAVAFALPVLVGMGMRWSARGEITDLRTANAGLDLENTSYRAATETLTGQIESLQAAITDLGERSQLNPETAEALKKLPAIVKSRAMGGGAVNSAMLAPSIASPEDTFGILRDLLNGLESHLSIVRRDVDRRATLAAATPSIWPVHGWLLAGFGMRRDPFTGEPAFHAGLDISGDQSTPVYATASGNVQSAGPAGDYGNLIVLSHGFGLETRYGHLSRFAVRPGQRVARGDVIGYVGATGRATGPHLHYEVLANGKALNPLSLLITRPQP